MHIPSKKEGIHLTNSVLRIEAFASVNIMNIYVKVKNPHETIRT
jgi:hypothetical protein